MAKYHSYSAVVHQSQFPATQASASLKESFQQFQLLEGVAPALETLEAADPTNAQHLTEMLEADAGKI